MLTRLAAKLVTGPFAFFLSGLIDVGAGLWLLARRRRRFVQDRSSD